jgi:DNA-binding transcriptional ArsR family regulator
MEARSMLEESLDALEGTGNHFLEAQHLRSLALLQHQQGDFEAALVTLDRADEVSVGAGFDDLRVELSSIRAMVWLALGDVDEALESTRMAVANLTSGVERPYLVHYRHALVAAEAGDPDEARRAAVEANHGLQTALSGLSPEQLDHALTRVPEHAEVVALMADVSPKTIEVRLPAIGAPVGKALESADLRPVTWTIAHPDDDRLDDPIERRRRRILRLLAEAEASHVSPPIEALAEALDVSEATIRRDLSALRDSGHSLHTRGSRQAS